MSYFMNTFDAASDQTFGYAHDAHSIIEDSSEIWGVVDVNRHLYRPVVFSYTCVAAAAFQRASLNYFAISG